MNDYFGMAEDRNPFQQIDPDRRDIQKNYANGQ